MRICMYLAWPVLYSPFSACSPVLALLFAVFVFSLWVALGEVVRWYCPPWWYRPPLETFGRYG